MTRTPEFAHEQRRVAWAMAGALITTIVVLGVVAVAARSAAPTPFADRLQAAIRLDGFVIAWLAAAIANVARLRFFSAQDIAGSGTGTGSSEVRQASAILQNTAEQGVLAIVTHMIVAAAFSRSHAVILALVCLFGVGRLLFWIGYGRGAKARAFGFALTFYPNVLALGAVAAAFLFGFEPVQ